MGGSEPPYLYDAPKHRPIAYPYSEFDPKAATRDSWNRAADAARPRPKQNGPLIDFNRHPDSYMIVTGTQVEFEPMPKNTKKWVAATRWVQFTLRVLQLFGALGALVCVICLKPTDGAQGWLIRIPPAWDTVMTLYGIYHLIRPAKARTPGSSASYHFFALLMDAGIIPFYVFTAIFANQNYVLPSSDQSRWTSYFDDTETTFLLKFTFWLAVAMAGSHLMTLAFDLYLIVVFRKIARLPPDMNPLEDNLTSRSSKHKYKNSEVSLASSATGKKAGFYSGSTLAGSVIDVNGSHLSTASARREARQIAFGDSRVDSDMTFSPHNPNSARLSRAQLDEYKVNEHSQPGRDSTVTFAGPRSTTSPARDRLEASLPTAPEQSLSTHAPSMLSTSGRETANSPAPNAAVTKAVARRQQKESLLGDNWYVLEDDPADIGLSSHGRSSAPTTSGNAEHLPTLRVTAAEHTFVPQPLRMNPPTPPLEEQHRRHHHPHSHSHSDSHQTQFQPGTHPVQQPYPDPETYPDPADTYAPLGEISVNRTLTVTSNATVSSSVYSESAPSLTSSRNAAGSRAASPDKSSASPAAKSKYYGDLAAATRGVRGGGAYAQVPQVEASPPLRQQQQQQQQQGGKYGRAPRFYAQGAVQGAIHGPMQGTPSPGSSPQGRGGPAERRGGGRVVSRSGADIADEGGVFAADGNGRRRVVSGKVAEEGRAGVWR